jgi:hypothetical protein
VRKEILLHFTLHQLAFPARLGTGRSIRWTSGGSTGTESPQQATSGLKLDLEIPGIPTGLLVEERQDNSLCSPSHEQCVVITLLADDASYGSPCSLSSWPCGTLGSPFIHPISLLELRKTQ